MSPVDTLAARNVLRSDAGGLKALVTALVMRLIPFGLSVLRRVWPIATVGSLVIVTRYDDVVEVFNTDQAFAVPYHDKLDVITGGQPFFLGMRDTDAYRSSTAALRRVIKPEDLAGLGDRSEARAAELVAASDGAIDVVAMVRTTSFDVMRDYLGVPRPTNGDIEVWATRLFEFQFADSGNDPALRTEVDVIAPAFRSLIQTEIARRQAAGVTGDDVLGRCLTLQAALAPGFGDDEIRTALLCVLVGGPPQPPMVVPQAMEQLLRRPAALAMATAAARSGDDARLAAIVLEAMRFDPLAPGLPRQITQNWTIAAGTPRAKPVKAGSTLLAAFASAMMDPRRLPDPGVFDPDRLPHEYLHFGHGLHECFGRHINGATLHRMLKPLLAKPNLRRASGRSGRLSKRGAFAERLIVAFG